MSALGQKRTWDCRLLMSALPPKADIVRYGGNVWSVPKADVVKKIFNRQQDALLKRIYMATPQAMRAPPPPRGAGWSE